MIFGNNTTTLNAVSIPMAEGYENYGVELSLVESARNDYAMFRAMLEADYKEMSICKESTGVVMEGELAALHEAVGGGIFKKIADFFRKLIGKIKAILGNFMARLRGLFSKDKDLVKRYGKDLARKAGLDKLEVKWRKLNGKFDGDAIGKLFNSFKTSYNPDNAEADFNEVGAKYDPDSWKRVQAFCGVEADNEGEAIKELVDEWLQEEDTVELKEIGGWRTLAVTMENGMKNISKFQELTNKYEKAIGKLVKKYDDKAAELSKTSVNATGEKAKAADEAIKEANQTYEMAVAFQTATNIEIKAIIEIFTIVYKQTKAAFMKAVTVNPKKLEESTVYAQAVAEAAETEVEDVITGALSKSEIEDLSAATTDVKDADVKDDPDALTYAPDCYTDDEAKPEVDGAVDTEINSKEESAFFGKMFY
jgi:hypothetical protein